MPVDAFAVGALAAELTSALDGCRIDKVQMPSRYEVHLSGRGPGGPYRLLLSAHPQRARVHLTKESFENPASPPMFCMFLRKHLTGGRFLGLEQPSLERILRLRWSTADEMGNISVKTLVTEMIGRHSNLILTDADGRILDCLRRVDPEMSPQRPVLPGLFYRDPPGQGKLSPLTVTENEFTMLWKLKQPELSVDDWLLNTFTALPPLLCRDIAESAADCGAVFSRLSDLAERVRGNLFIPMIIKNGMDFVSLPLKSIPQEPFHGSFSALLDALYTNRDRAEQLSQRASGLQKTARSNREKLRKKLGYLRQELLDAQNREHIREKADLLMANLHRAERGAEAITVEDFYHDGHELRIKLDPAKSIQQNAAALYKSYAKLKNAETALAAQISQAEREEEYWESVGDQLTRVANERDLDEIRDELHPAKVQVGGKNRKREKPVSQPTKFRSTAGFTFRAGRNNRQNDLLTMRLAGRGDVWLHTQKIPGCHTVIETNGAEPDEQTLLEAATVAAWFSQARTSPKVPVDYTAVRNVKKPSGARPGMVIYDRFKTILVEPNEDLVKRLSV
ncbi:MAG: NFACT family protein [Oscillospiraceae bacterium]|jgi:predicted ribosome quality control (RQC) complex YloA/Tae2 family protein|nr:NFACT family protein [Oscillospiraceae bacterium]